jgi:hypothetical protein
VGDGGAGERQDLGDADRERVLGGQVVDGPGRVSQDVHGRIADNETEQAGVASVEGPGGQRVTVAGARA